MGVSAEVDAASIRRLGHTRAHRDDSHRQRGGHCPDDGADTNPADTPQAPQAVEQHRPQQVELLLNRERPEVLEQRRPARRVEVRHALADVPPVRDVGQCCQRIPADESRRILGEPGGQQRGDDEHQKECGQQSARAMLVEAGEPEPTTGMKLGDQQRGDQEAREGEEDVDAQEPTWQPGGISVKKQHGHDRDGTHTIETREMDPGSGR